MRICLYEVVPGVKPKRIGAALFDSVPPVGALLGYVAGPGRVSWRVIAVQISPTMEGSLNARAHERGERGVQLGIVEVFVVASEGPHDVDAYDRFVGEVPTP